MGLRLNHRFAMGLQVDEEGNFYYAKSARHAKQAIVPHHGTLLKVAKYGSKHFNERATDVSAAELSDDGLAAELTIPDLAPTWGMSIQMKLRSSKGEKVGRELHNSIFTLDF